MQPKFSLAGVVVLFAISTSAADHLPETKCERLKNMDILTTNLFYQAEDYFAEVMSDRSLNFGNFASAYCSNVDDSPLNTLVIRQAPPSLTNLLDQARDFFAATNTPWCIIMRSDLVDQDSLDTLAKFDFMLHEPGVAMVLSLKDTALAPEPADECQNMDGRLAEWIVPLKAFPSSHQDVPLTYQKCHELASQKGKNITHLSLFSGGQAVCSLTLTWDRNWVRIDDLATDPDFQGKGYAKRLLSHALSFAARKNVKWCFLEASSKGLSLYDKMGFTPLFQNQVFLKADPSQ